MINHITEQVYKNTLIDHSNDCLILVHPKYSDFRRQTVEKNTNTCQLTEIAEIYRTLTGEISDIYEHN